MVDFKDFGDKMKIIGAEVDSPVCEEEAKICFECAEGCYLYDSNGKKYIDLINGKGAVVLGHNDSNVNEAIIKSIEQKQNIHTGPTQILVDLSDILIKDCGLDDAKVTYFTTGTSACRAAASVARMYTGKNIILSAGYHGWDVMWGESEGFLEKNQYGVVNFYFIPELLEQCIEKYHGEIALIMISPDYVYLESKTLHRIAEQAKENGILLCCDDVKQGYRYRKGDSLSQATNIKADLYTFSKGLANGNRISCLLGKSELLEFTKDFSFTSFYNMIPYYAAVATLTKMAETNGYEYLNQIGDKLSKSMNMVFAQSQVPIRVFGHGPMLQFVCANDDLEEIFYSKSIENGLLLFVKDNQAVSCAVNAETIREVCDILQKVTVELRDHYPQYMNERISSERIFKTAWEMIDGAADIGTYEDRIKWIKELI